MGRIKTKMIKRISKKLVRSHESELKDNFEENKQAVSRLAEMPSKKLRNTIAGYVTRMMRRVRR